jgi:hypothetical protein
VLLDSWRMSGHTDGKHSFGRDTPSGKRIR